jgi:hypothetical protein
MNSYLYLQFAVKFLCKYLWRQRTDGRYLPFMRLLPENNRYNLGLCNRSAFC